MIDACQWYKSSPTGPAEHEVGGSLFKLVPFRWQLYLSCFKFGPVQDICPFYPTYLPKSANSFLIRFVDILVTLFVFYISAAIDLCVCNPMLTI